MMVTAVLQGDVESIASKNPKDLTALFEQISGSDELKKEYEQKERAKMEAEERLLLASQKRKNTVLEKKQKKEQKDEAEKHMQKQRELVRRISHSWRCFKAVALVWHACPVGQ